MSRRSPRLSVKDAAAYLGKSTKTVHRLITRWRAGDPAGLEAINTGGEGPGARYQLELTVLDRWLESRRVDAA